MNPLTNVKNINKLNETELAKGTVNKKSWHDLYKDSAWIFIGGLAYGLTEGDILCVFSQYGEIVNLNHVRDKKTGKTKGFCFLCYANQKSTILAVDNLNGIKVCGRTIRVDHVSNYKPPKDNEQDDEITKILKAEGCAPKPIKVESSPSIEAVQKKKNKKHKKEKKKHKKKKRDDPDEEFSLDKVKKEKNDEGYSKYEFPEKFKNSIGKKESTENKSSCDSSDSNSNHISRKEKHESQSCNKNYLNTSKKHSKHDKSTTNKHEKHQIESSKYKRRKESGSSSESDSPSKRKRKLPDINDDINGLSLERRDVDHYKYKGRNLSNSSSDEYSERHKSSRKNSNRDHNVRSSSSRYHRHDSSPESERNCNLKKSSKDTYGTERDKHGTISSMGREKNPYDKRHQDDHVSRELPHKTAHRYKDYGEKYERFDKRGDKKEYSKHRFEQKER